MYPRYYALRRVNPYRGVIQVVDMGDAVARSHDGLTWHLRADDGHGLVRPVGVWEEGAGLKVGLEAGLGDLFTALQGRPPLPFPIFDTQELWLLDREKGLPLALLATEQGGVRRNEQPDPEWHPFVRSYTAFRSQALARRDATAGSGTAHKDTLARLVNQAARPHPMAQWFQRGQDGIGHGGPGLRLPYEWRDRRVEAADFPELLVREIGNSRLEQSVISDYHAWLAPLLLLWPRLSNATRARLERQACLMPRWLARVYRLLPTQVDPACIQAALVAARLEQAQEGADNMDLPW